MSVCPFVRPSVRLAMKFNISVFFEKWVEKIQVSSKSDNNNNNKLQLGCHPVAVVILPVYKI